MHGYVERIESKDLDSSVCEDEARAELERLLEDPEFHSTERNKKFLRFVAEELFQGRSESVKAYSVAVDVFGRPPTFDPAIDPIVRIEATRLRASLTRYYERHGREGGVYVDLPKGRYVPVFGRYDSSRGASLPQETTATPEEEALGDGAAGAPVPRKIAQKDWLLVALGVATAALFGATFLHRLSEAGSDILSEKPQVFVETRLGDDGVGAEASRMQDLILGALSRFSTLKVTDARLPSAVKAGAGGLLPRASPSVPIQQAVYRIELEYWPGAGGERVSWKLLDLGAGEVLMSGEERLHTDSQGAAEGMEQLAAQVATGLAGMRGLINSIETTRDVENPTLGNGCLLRSYLALRSEEAENLKSARLCLEGTLALRKGDPDIYAALSRVLLASDSVDNPTALSNRALQLADQAVSLAPYSDRAAEAQMHALQRAGRTQAAIAAGRRAMILNPDNTDVLGRLSGLLVLAGEWEAGVGMALTSERMDPAMDADAQLTLAFEDYRQRRFEQALARLQQFADVRQFDAGLLQQATLAQLGRHSSAPEHQSSLRAAMTARHYGPELIALIETGLAKAGIPLD